MERLGYDALRRPGRRLGQCRHRAAGAAEARGTAGHPHQHAGDALAGDLEGRPARRSGARRPRRPTRRTAYEILVHFFATGIGYAEEMGNRPQTLYGIEDSPVGLAAWMLDHDERSYELIARAFAGKPGGLSRDDVLDNVTHYWLTNIGGLLGAPVLGEQAGLLRRQGRRAPGRRDRLPGRALSGAAELG